MGFDMGKTIDSVVDFAGDAKDAVTDFVSDAKDVVVDKTVEFAGTVKETTEEAIEIVQEKAVEAHEAIVKETKEIAHDVQEKIEDIGNKVSSKTEEVINDVQEKAGEIVSDVKETAVETFEVVKTETVEIAGKVETSVKSLNDNYISKVIPDFGKYGDVAKFGAEMLPGVSEYNAIVEGDWSGFAIAAGIDIGSFALGMVTAGAGFAFAKGGSEVAKAGVKTATKEVAKAGTKKVVKETTETAAKNVVKEVVEESTKNITKEIVEDGAKKATKEITEDATKKITKEIAEDGTKKVVKETAEEVDRNQIVTNKLKGIEREEKVLRQLENECKESGTKLIREAYLLNNEGERIIDAVTGEARRIDFIVVDNKKVIKSIEVTSETASKEKQVAKELRILEFAKKNGGAFIKDKETAELIKFGNVNTEIRRLP